MALKLAFKICQTGDCKNIKVYEETGAYNASTNTTGWGTPNAAAADVTATSLTVTMPDETTATFTDMLTEGFPTTDCTKEYTITSTGLGYGGASLPDGLYKFVFTYTTASATYSQTVWKLFYCQAECCVHSLVAEIAKSGCDCSSETSKKGRLASALLEGLKDAARCGSTELFDDYIESINNMCATGDCGCS